MQVSYNYCSLSIHTHLMSGYQVVQLFSFHHSPNPGLQHMLITRYSPNITLKTRAAVLELRHLGDGLSVMSSYPIINYRHCATYFT